MHAVFADTYSRGELVHAELPAPRPGPRELLVEVHASAMNPHDWKYYSWFQGLYRSRLPLPALRLGHDFSGVVIGVGRKVRRFAIGDAVYGMTAKPGAFAQQIVIDERMAAKKPAGLSHPQAAALPMVGLTAVQALRYSGLQAQSKLLVIGGSGGVGMLAVQIAKAQGAHVTAVCSERNVDFVTALGADEVIDYTRQKIHDSRERFDIIFDTIGQESVASCHSLLKSGAHFVSTETSLKNAASTLRSRAVAWLRPDAIVSGTLLAMPWGADLRKIGAMVEAGQITVNIDRSFPLERLQEAIDYSQQGRTRGKIVIAVKP